MATLSTAALNDLIPYLNQEKTLTGFPKFTGNSASLMSLSVPRSDVYVTDADNAEARYTATVFHKILQTLCETITGPFRFVVTLVGKQYTITKCSLSKDSNMLNAGVDLQNSMVAIKIHDHEAKKYYVVRT